MRKACFAFLIVLAVPCTTHAAVRISEVMYDPSGSDAGHEWVEIYNDGSATDISTWRLLEGGSKHKLTPSAVGTISPNGYAILADNPSTFTSDYPNFHGLVFDTAFSGGLNNKDGESLALLNDAGVTIDSITYSSAIGAAGDGNSLQKTANGWIPAKPTPGAVNATTASATASAESKGESATTVSSAVKTVSTENTAAVVLHIGEDRTVMMGMVSVFSATVTDGKGAPLPDASVHWNLGDGSVAVGTAVTKAYHTAGEYLVSVNANTQSGSAHAEYTVTVVAPAARITVISEEGITIANDAATRLDLSSFQLSVGQTAYRFPEGTILLPNASVTFQGDVTGLPFVSTGAVLRNPDGSVLATYEDSIPQLPAREASSYKSATDVPKSISNKESTNGYEEAIAPTAASTLAAVGAAMPLASSTPSHGLMALITSPWTLGFVALILLSGAALLIL